MGGVVKKNTLLKRLFSDSFELIPEIMTCVRRLIQRGAWDEFSNTCQAHDVICSKAHRQWISTFTCLTVKRDDR